MTTLAEAQAWLRERLYDGAHCPCCTQFAKIYKRQIHATMARDLIRSYRRFGRAWFHLPTASGYGGDNGKWRYWDLAEEDESRQGWWRLTTTGEAFVLGRHRVPKYAHLYDGKLLRLEGSLVTIKEALRQKFNYDELMAGI